MTVFTDSGILATGDTIAAADWNAWLRDNFGLNFPAAVGAKGDLAVATGSQAASNLAIGSTDQIIEADSAQANGVKNSWAFVPVGGIIMWAGLLGSLPANWQICDGTNGTPDLRDRFLVGAGSSYAVGANGGAATANLQHDHNGSATASTGAHTHTQPNTSATTHFHRITSSAASATISAQASSGASAGVEDHTHLVDTAADVAHVHAKSATGSSGDHSHPLTADNQLSSSQSILPPYYALAYVMRLS